MRIIRLLIILTAFLIMISTAMTLFGTSEKTTIVYINVAAMACLIAIITLINFRKNNQNNQ